MRTDGSILVSVTSKHQDCDIYNYSHVISLHTKHVEQGFELCSVCVCVCGVIWCCHCQEI